MATLLLVSATREDTARLLENGPRRDFVELARAVDGEIMYSPGRLDRRRLLGRILGPHVRQAWTAASRARSGDAIFADGEHIGLPLALFLRLRVRRNVRVVMLGHLLSRRWKRPLLWLAARVGVPATLVLHSVEQRRVLAPIVGRRWRIALVPYQVDTEYWTPGPERAPNDVPLVVAVGSENRDYDTLVEAARGLNARVVIAAGSHWARSIAAAHNLPANVEYLRETLSFAELRELYRSAEVVVVPLHDVENQSGVTTILEAMSMGLPVVVTATRGQRECVTGPLVLPDGTLDWEATRDRGPQVFTGTTPVEGRSGYYVPPRDALSLRAALRANSDSPGAPRIPADQTFKLEEYVERLTALTRRA
jgi:glycosyltransferase involved in cell wall biosynthesis